MTTLHKLTDALLTLDERVAVLTLNRNDLRNALTGSALIDDIVSTAEWVNQCDEVSVLVITGAGSAFSAGGNIPTWPSVAAILPATWLSVRIVTERASSVFR